ncbi:MAG: hypothetical protein DRQ60_02115 [Gammaproteobacteria bacterium]|nr:MAG: hypothetical protein DRQ60_02115 [Gammaproteobacteria bacterium]
MGNSSGLSSRQFGMLTAIAVTALVLTVVNIGAANANAKQRQDFIERQLFITQSVKLRRVGAELVKTVAQVATQTQDQQLTDLLGKFGITFKTAPVGQADSAGLYDE